LRLIPVGRRQSNIDVLSGEMSRPAQHIEEERAGARGFLPHGTNGGNAPGDSWCRQA
jgi:hypothetical protein